MDQPDTDDAMSLAADIGVAPVGQPYFPLGFHVSAEAWLKYGFRDLLGEAPGSNAHQQIHVARQLAHRIHLARSAEEQALASIGAGHLLAFGLLEEVLRYVFEVYCREQNPGVLEAAIAHTGRRRGSEHVERPLQTFAALFPPQSVHILGEAVEGFLLGRTGKQAHKSVALRETVLLSLAVENPALKPCRSLFDDTELKRRAPYRDLVSDLDEYFRTQPRVDPMDLNLFACLRAPMHASPDSLDGQLEYIRSHWAKLLPKWLMRRLLAARDTLREETFMRGFGPGRAEVLRFRGAGAPSYPEPERFTQDADWMSKVVLIAKIAYVWLDQLSRQYNRPITRLDQIPEEELDRLALWGFTGLWLIGLWERSCASQHIKQRMGNSEAAASAYSLYDYAIAYDLGGEAALLNLRERALRRGIRLASDMVPNHVGIYSKWAIEHPDWFIQCPQPPFPGYRFSGPSLCPEERVGIYIEDGYWDRRDAAVVFKRVDHWTGDTRYIYHGNDGTHMPWNDTAQLNYLLPDVREAVIRTILHVAGLFPIIRFDAAMTLAKRHYQRLWFPLPGEGGAIPSRSEHSMTIDDFNTALPEEFWRQVVDRVQTETPDTLLLAEAFWLMEGYFVRTLGMHRVYNSAFMNMLKQEENLNYRMTVKNVLEFSPEVLKRFVNFMNNPDEMTAVQQFGNGDKYFGVAMMMVTMPGLPMFGHGQIEGFTEKYGMEYRKAYWDETVDGELVRRHEREIFPLMRKRYLFSGVENFAFYDFIHPGGYVDENVFAYSNRSGDERVLVAYNNAYAATEGRVVSSTAINVGSPEAERYIHRSLAEALALRDDPAVFYIFRDHRDGLQYIREGKSLTEQGMWVTLQGYQYRVFLDFREVVDINGVWSQVAQRLGGSGTSDIARTYREILLAPMLVSMRAVIDPDLIRQLADCCETEPKGIRAGKRRSTLPSSAIAPKPTARRTVVATKARRRLEKALRAYLVAAETQTGLPCDKTGILAATLRDVRIIQDFPKGFSGAKPSSEMRAGFQALLGNVSEDAADWRTPIMWAIIHRFEEVLAVGSADSTAGWIEEWLLADAIMECFLALGRDERRAREDTQLVVLLTRHTPEILAASEDAPAQVLEAILEDRIARSFLYVNEFGGTWWMNKEQIQEALLWLFVTSTVSVLADDELTSKQQGTVIKTRLACIRNTLDAAEQAGYDIGKTLMLLHQP